MMVHGTISISQLNTGEDKDDVPWNQNEVTAKDEF